MIAVTDFWLSLLPTFDSPHFRGANTPIPVGLDVERGYASKKTFNGEGGLILWRSTFHRNTITFDLYPQFCTNLASGNSMYMPILGRTKAIWETAC